MDTNFHFQTYKILTYEIFLVMFSITSMTASFATVTLYHKTKPNKMET